MTRRRVPQVVEPEVGQPGSLDGLLEPRPNLPPVRSILALEHATAAFLCLRLQGAERRARRQVQGHAARLPILRFVQCDPCVESQIRVEFDPLPRQIQNLALPHAGVNRERDHAGQVLVARRRTGGQQLLNLMFHQVARAPVWRLRKFDLRHPIEVVLLSLRQPAQVPQNCQVIVHGPGVHFGDAALLVSGDLLRRELTDRQPGPEGREQLFLQNPFVLVK